MSGRPQAKPKYILKGPREEKVTMTLYSKSVTEEEVGPLEQTVVEKVMPCWRLFIPHGPNGEYNSIRITSKEKLRELGIDPEFTPLVDPETGETIGTFQHKVAQDYGPDPELVTTKPARSKATEGAE